MNASLRLFLVAVALNTSSISYAVQYSFSRIYDKPVRPGVAINDNGLVALSDGDSLITTDGHTQTMIAGLTSPNYLWPNDNWQVFSLNNSGFVAFRGYAPGGTFGMFSSNGTISRKIAANTSYGGLFYDILTQGRCPSTTMEWSRFRLRKPRIPIILFL